MGNKPKLGSVTLTRRVFNAILTVLLFIPVLSRAGSRTVSDKKIKIAPVSVKTVIFTRFCDAVIPADETPSASDLKIDDVLFSELQKYKSFRSWPGKLEKWLLDNSLAVFEKGLDEISDDQFEELVAQFANDKKHFLFTGFNFSRHTLMKQYYSNEASWIGLTEYHAPQPLGYMNFTKRPLG